MRIIDLRPDAPVVKDEAVGEPIAADAWLKDRDSNQSIVHLPNTEDPAVLAGHLHKITAVYLDFPKFSDGRAFSQAALLRGQYGFTGEIRARGEVLCDQALFMARCGFDVLEIGDGNADGFLTALHAFSANYQKSAADGAPVWQRRLTGARRAAA